MRKYLLKFIPTFIKEENASPADGVQIRKNYL